MKKGIRLAALCAAVLLCVIVYLLIPRNADAPTPTPEPTSFSVLSIDASEIASLHWTYALRTMYFQQDHGNWQYPEDEHFPLDQNGGRFQTLLAALEHVTAGRYLPDVTDLAEYGLEQPATVITVTRTDSSETTISVGAQNPVTLEYYLQVSGDSGVYLVDSTLPLAFDCGLFDLIKMDEIPDLSTATEYRINGRTYHKSGDGIWCDSNDTPIDVDITALLSALAYNECIDYYADYYEAHREYALTEGDTIAVSYLVNGEIAEWALAFSHDYDENYVIASPVVSDLVYTISKETINALRMQ